MNTATITKQDVYDPRKDDHFAGQLNAPFSQVRMRAQDLDFEYTLPLTDALVNNPYFFRVDTGTSVDRYDNISDGPPAEDARTFMQKVMDYVGSPERSSRGEVIALLNDHEFFDTNDEDEQKRIIWSILGPNAGYFCGTGREKAREALGLTEDQFQHDFVLTIKLTANNSLYSDSDVIDTVTEVMDDFASENEVYNIDVTSVRLTRGNEDADD